MELIDRSGQGADGFTPLGDSASVLVSWREKQSFATRRG
jgi:hypothetical protein